jgi:hypothetical protein
VRAVGINHQHPHSDLVERRRKELKGRLWRFVLAWFATPS